MDDKLVIAGKEFTSRLMLGTGKFSDVHVQKAAVEASGAEILTVAVRRLNLGNPGGENILALLDMDKYQWLPNTAGATTVEEAVRLARLARATGLSNWIKVEVVCDLKTLLPDPVATLEATKILVEEGFVVLPYTNDCPVTAKKLEEAGAAAVMPGGAPIGSGLGILNPHNIRLMKEYVSVPIIIDAGLGSASDAAYAMELGADGVLMNTAVSGAQDPVKMAEAMKHAVIAGRLSYLAGRIPKKPYATASSPMEGMIE
ncbi:MAG: thiazole synthase [Eubacteriales bacterium]|nr:thiazole synthase [Eubacteriales bacterium]